MINHTHAKFGRHRGSVNTTRFSLSRDLDVVTSPTSAGLVSFDSTLLNVPAYRIWWHRSYGNGDIYFFISSYMNTWEKAKLTVSIRHIERFSRSRYWFTIPKFQTRLAENQEKEQEENHPPSPLFQVGLKSPVIIGSTNEVCIRKRCNWIFVTCFPFWYLMSSVYSPNDT